MGITYREMVLFRPNVALDFVRDCQVSGTRLLGFDAFRLLSGGFIQPLMEDSLDVSLERFSKLDEGQKCEIAEQFLKERLDKDLLFEMVVDSPIGY